MRKPKNKPIGLTGESVVECHLMGGDVVHAHRYVGVFAVIAYSVAPCVDYAASSRCCIDAVWGVYSTLKAISLDLMRPSGPHLTFGLLALSALIQCKSSVSWIWIESTRTARTFAASSEFLAGVGFHGWESLVYANHEHARANRLCLLFLGWLRC
jgi:hypothetical protein